MEKIKYNLHLDLLLKVLNFEFATRTLHRKVYCKQDIKSVASSDLSKLAFLFTLWYLILANILGYIV